MLIGVFTLNSCGPSEKEIKEKEEYEQRKTDRAWAQKLFREAPEKINKILEDNYDFSGTQDNIVDVEFVKISTCEYEFIEYGKGNQVFHYKFNIKDLKLEYPSSRYFKIKTDGKYIREIVKADSDYYSWKKNTKSETFVLANKRAAQNIYSQLKNLKGGC